MKNALLLLLALIWFNSYSQIGTKNFIDQNYIEVIGKAEIEIIPNEIYLTIRLDENDLKGKIDLVTIEKRMLSSLGQLGIDITKDLQIKDMASNFSSYWLKKSLIVSSREYVLKVHNTAIAGKVFQELELIGISNIRVDKIDHDDIHSYKDKMRVKAIVAAKEKANLLTQALGHKTGKALFINELNANVYKGLQDSNARLSNIVVKDFSNHSKIKQEVRIEFEKIRLNYSILVRFAIVE